MRSLSLLFPCHLAFECRSVVPSVPGHDKRVDRLVWNQKVLRIDTLIKAGAFGVVLHAGCCDVVGDTATHWCEYVARGVL